MKKSFTLLIAFMMPLFIFGQSYASLWKKVAEADRKDLPQTTYEVLQQIVKKAEKEKAYGQLLKAELMAAQALVNISPDSLKPAVERIQERCDATSDEVLKTVYQTVLYRVYIDNHALEGVPAKPELTESLCKKLAKVKEDSYIPFVQKGRDADYYECDLLNIIGYELSEYQKLYDFYAKTGNRRAACLLASKEYLSQERYEELIGLYGDLPEAGELAIRRYQAAYMQTAEKIAFIHEALQKWGSWKRMDYLKNEERYLTNPQFHVAYDSGVVTPGQSQEVRLTDLRNVKSVTMKVYKVNARGDIEDTPTYKEGYNKIKPLLQGVVAEQVRTYTGKEAYEIFEDKMTLEGLPVGVYMTEFETNPSTEVIRRLYFVTDVYTISEGQPDNETVRYVVVSASTGQPIAGAKLHIEEHISYRETKEYDVVCDEKGEYFFKTIDAARRRSVFAYTDQDQACPELNGNNTYSYRKESELEQRTCLYTDRAIYRPGQTVHASALIYDVKYGVEQSAVKQKGVIFMLRDANYKVIQEIRAVTDDYGVCAVDFTLPSAGLTGIYTIRANGQSMTVRVEEYKRPTFHVDFPEVKEAYQPGDTLTVKASAMSYAGVPVQGGKVKYKVVRRTAYWWWSYSSYWNTSVLGYGNEGTEIFSSETETDQNGQFDVQMPLTLPETSYPMFYHFVVTADVTDSAGETHQGQFSLPIGNRKQALSVDLTEKVLLEDQPKVTFHLLNAAGKDLDAEVSYRIDEGDWKKAKTNTPLLIADKLSSGKHQLEAVCEGDSVKRDFVLFSLDDEKPATETDDWFYLSAQQFKNDQEPVTIQVGSSDPDVHIVYSVFADNRIIEQGSVDKSNQLFNIKVTYEEDYGSGLLFTFAWVKNGKCHTHQAVIKRPLPDKKLRLQWTTFRDRLTPGQQEEWMLTVKDCDGKPADAQLMATLYDQSLDQLVKHQWSLSPYVYLSVPSVTWGYAIRRMISESAQRHYNSLNVRDLVFSKFDHSVYPRAYYHSIRAFGRGAVMGRAKMANAGMVLEDAAPMEMEEPVMKMAVAQEAEVDMKTEQPEELGGEQVQVRENLNETAFFYPQLMTDDQGNVALKFTLPESLTTWRFMGIAHTRDMFYGSIEGESVAQKDVMIQPNVPRFLRDGDQGKITARIFNTGEITLTGKALLKLIDPETDAIVAELSQPVTLKAGETTAVTFDYTPDAAHSLLICQTIVSGKDFSDGEQHYLPILPSKERVTITVPITQHQPGTKTIDLAALLPADATNGKLTFEYTNNPAWLMIQALPALGQADNDNAISQAAAFYANSIGKFIIDQNPKARGVFALWQQEQGSDTSLMSALEKNQELKDIVLNETPWVMDADNETEQKQRLADFFDENLMQNRLSQNIAKLQKLQRGDGSWSWWPDMPGSFYMTVAVSEMFVRLNVMTDRENATKAMLSRAFDFMGESIVEDVKQMKKEERKGHKQYFPSFKALQWLYLVTLDGRSLPAEVVAANDYLLKLLKKEIKNQSIYEKAMTAVILSKSDPQRAAEYVQSLKEYTVFSEEMGRYYDTPRAGYSWYDYKIPTQTMAIEALQRLSADDRQTIEEMQRWLLQEKRTQAWDTPINSVNAVYAFLNGNSLKLGEQQATVTVDNQPLALPQSTAGIGYVKTPVAVESKVLTVEKTSEGTSWGAVYAQFVQPTKSIADTGSGITVKRELLAADGQLLSAPKVGDRIKVRITIDSDRDYDFVQVLDKRAACMEPVRQLSGWHSGSYCTPKDNSTNYYFDRLSKGRHIIENEYYIDRAGTYETGTCTVECAYSPEFRGTTHSQTLTIQQ